MADHMLLSVSVQVALLSHEWIVRKIPFKKTLSFEATKKSL